MSSDRLGVWDPFTPAAIEKLFLGCTAPWWITGGNAIDAFVRRFDRRPHADIDIGLLARDQAAVRSCLARGQLALARRSASTLAP